MLARRVRRTQVSEVDHRSCVSLLREETLVHVLNGENARGRSLVVILVLLEKWPTGTETWFLCSCTAQTPVQSISSARIATCRDGSQQSCALPGSYIFLWLLTSHTQPAAHRRSLALGQLRQLLSKGEMLP